MTLFDYVKTVVLILLLAYFLPSILDTMRKHYGRILEPATQVGVITIDSTIHNSSSYTQDLFTLFKNPDIKAILLRIDCSGGAVGSTQQIYLDILELKKEYPKFIVALVENTCISGGYLIASAADHIIAPPSALIGSIGVTTSSLFKLKELIETYKIYYVSLKAGTYKGISDPFVDMTEADKAHLQLVLDDTYHQLARMIASSRKLSLATLSQWGDGKLFTAHQALKLHLIDEIGSTYAAIARIKDKTLTEGDIDLISLKKEHQSLLGWLFNRSNCADRSFLAHVTDGVITCLQNKINLNLS